MEEEFIQREFLHLTDKTSPAGSTKNEKRYIQKQAEKFVVENGEIYYKKMGLRFSEYT